MTICTENAGPLTMKRLMPGLYAGDTVRCEYYGTGGWEFQVRGRALHPLRPWIEYSPAGAWCSIGRWLRRKDGLFAAEQLRRGTHFWDNDLHRTRLYDQDVFAALREKD